MGYAQTVCSSVELRCGTRVPGGGNSPKWDGRHSLVSTGLLAPLKVTTPTAPTGEAWLLVTYTMSKTSDLQTRLLPVI